MVNKEILAIKDSILKTVGNDCEKIILFGSYAYGTLTEGSDYDVFVVLKDGTEKPILVLQNIYGDLALNPNYKSVDVLANYKSSFEARSKLPAIERTIANKGVVVEPRIVKKVVDNKTGEVENIEVKEKGRAISEKTAKEVLSMMESVVNDGTGRNAAVQGYGIGGKTGTSEDGVNTNKYITSFLGVADVKDPSVVIAIVLYNPTGEGGHQGGVVAAPVAGEILSEVLAYLEVSKNEKDDIKESVKMPGVEGLTLDKAIKKLKDAGLGYKIKNKIPEEVKLEDIKVKSQLPKKNIIINTGTKIILEI